MSGLDVELGLKIDFDRILKVTFLHIEQGGDVHTVLMFDRYSFHNQSSSFLTLFEGEVN